MFMDALQWADADARTLFDHVCSRCDAMTLPAVEPCSVWKRSCLCDSVKSRCRGFG
jgi:hypothetical protein